MQKKYLLILLNLIFLLSIQKSYADAPSELNPIVSRLARCEKNKPRHECVDTLSSKNGVLYIGEFYNEKAEGYGNIYIQSVLRFAGEFKDGKKNGFGRSLKSDGTYSEGIFKDNKLNGFGSTRFSDGSYYIGEFKDGKLDGYGTMLMSDGSRFTGISREGEPNGQGVIDHVSGAKLIGNFKNKTLDGPGTIVKPDGVRVDAIFNDGEIVKITARSDVVGDASPDDQFCKAQGINPGATDYNECRINIAVHRSIARDRKAENELRAKLFEEQMEIIRQHRKEQQSLAIFNLLGNFLSSKNQSNDFAPFIQSAPVFDQFTIFRRGQSSVNCVMQSNIIDCK